MAAFIAAIVLWQQAPASALLMGLSNQAQIARGATGCSDPHLDDGLGLIPKSFQRWQYEQRAGNRLACRNCARYRCAAIPNPLCGSGFRRYR